MCASLLSEVHRNNWVDSRSGHSAPQELRQNIEMAAKIVFGNLKDYAFSLTAYLLITTLSNSLSLIVYSYIKKDSSKSPQELLTGITTNFLSIFLVAFTRLLILTVVSRSIKKRKYFAFSELFNFKNIFSTGVFFKLITFVLIEYQFASFRSECTIFSAKFVTDIAIGLIYSIIGYAQIFMVEDSSIPLIQCYEWSVFAFMKYPKQIIVLSIISSLTMRLGFTVPFLIVAQILQFYQIHGVSDKDGE